MGPWGHGAMGHGDMGEWEDGGREGRGCWQVKVQMGAYTYTYLSLSVEQACEATLELRNAGNRDGETLCEESEHVIHLTGGMAWQTTSSTCCTGRSGPPPGACMPCHTPPCHNPPATPPCPWHAPLELRSSLPVIHVISCHPCHPFLPLSSLLA